MRPTLDQLVSEVERDWERAQREARGGDLRNLLKGAMQAFLVFLPALVVIVCAACYLIDKYWIQ